MAQGKVRIGILGAGDMGRAHAVAYRSIETAEVAGVWSRSAERALGAARIVGASVVADAAG